MMNERTTSASGPGAIFVTPEAYADPDRWHRTAATLRASSPVHRVELDGYRPFYAITRHADIMAIERRSDIFENGLTSVLENEATLRAVEERGPALRTLINMDGEDHRAHRGTTAEWFKPSAIRRLADQVDTLAAHAVEAMIANGPRVDFVNDVALHFPLRVIMTILGVPPEDEPLMLRLTQEMFGTKDPEYSRGSDVEDTVAIVKDFMRYFWRIVEARRTDPADDLATVIANATIGDTPLGRLETISYFVLIATAGHDTTSTAISGGLDALLDHPAQLHALRDDPERVGLAVEEMIRWVSPVKHFMRTARTEFDLNGHLFRAGDWLLLSYASANRDETVFPEPFEFDVARANAASHLAFGFGVHFCLGAQLARLEMRAIYRELLARIRRIERAGPTEYTKTTFVGGPKRLPVRFEA